MDWQEGIIELRGPYYNQSRRGCLYKKASDSTKIERVFPATPYIRSVRLFKNRTVCTQPLQPYYREHPKIGNYPTLTVCIVLHMDRRECGSFLFSGFPCITNIITCSTLLTSPYIYISKNTFNQVFQSLVTCTHFYRYLSLSCACV